MHTSSNLFESQSQDPLELVIYVTLKAKPHSCYCAKISAIEHPQILNPTWSIMQNRFHLLSIRSIISYLVKDASKLVLSRSEKGYSIKCKCCCFLWSHRNNTLQINCRTEITITVIQKTIHRHRTEDLEN